MEDFLYEKIEKKKPNRLSNLEYLGQDMNEAGNEFGPGTPYGRSQFICSSENVFLIFIYSLKSFIYRVRISKPFYYGFIKNPLF